MTTAAPRNPESLIQAAMLLAGRILLALIFVVSGFGKLTGISGTAAYMSSAGIPYTEVLVWPAAIIEFGAGILLLLGWKARWAAIALIVFTAAATVVFHAFWAVEPAQVQMQQIMFMKNSAIIGGLLYVAAHGPGRLAVERS
ncbi:MAG: DoxX family protein [Chromatiales bacterium]